MKKIRGFKILVLIFFVSQSAMATRLSLPSQSPFFAELKTKIVPFTEALKEVHKVVETSHQADLTSFVGAAHQGMRICFSLGKVDSLAQSLLQYLNQHPNEVWISTTLGSSLAYGIGDYFSLRYFCESLGAAQYEQPYDQIKNFEQNLNKLRKRLDQIQTAL